MFEGFSAEEVDNLRTQFHSIRGTDVHVNFDTARNAEEEWIDNATVRDRESSNNSISFSLMHVDEEEGSNMDVLIGLLAGFFMGVLVLFWIKEHSLFTRRQQMGIIAGLLLNISFGILVRFNFCISY
ncbi:DUF2407 C-terminal domain-containing protein [Chytridium lagenaria]|nr:DUF2407 C-terminal domain-containing protein [Chytridium lagenaria]